MSDDVEASKRSTNDVEVILVECAIFMGCWWRTGGGRPCRPPPGGAAIPQRLGCVEGGGAGAAAESHSWKRASVELMTLL